MKTSAKALSTVGADSRWRRARRPEQKQVRREAILLAARDLIDRKGVDRTTLSDIARGAHISKTNCYRYFENREAILLQVVLEETRDWTDAIVRDLSRLSGSGDFGAVSELLVRETLNRPRLCELASAMWTVLEQNVSVEVLANFKYEFRKTASQWTTSLTKALPSLSEDQAKQFSLFFLLFVASAWSACKHSPVLDQLLMREEFADTKVDLDSALSTHTLALLKGLTAP